VRTSRDTATKPLNIWLLSVPTQGVQDLSWTSQGVQDLSWTSNKKSSIIKRPYPKMTSQGVQDLSWTSQGVQDLSWTSNFLTL
jgi:D-hexose-6-phosphate mutarotase